MTRTAEDSRAWVWWSAGASLGVAGIWLAAVMAGGHDPGNSGDRWGLGFGMAAALLGVLQFLYPLRRRTLARPFGTAVRALRFHLGSSTVMFVCVLAHQGTAWPSGWMGVALLSLSGWAVVSGLAGRVIQRAVPPMLIRHTGTTRGLFLERVLRLWPFSHGPLGVGLLALVVWHVFAVLYY